MTSLRVNYAQPELDLTVNFSLGKPSLVGESWKKRRSHHIRLHATQRLRRRTWDERRVLRSGDTRCIDSMLEHNGEAV